MPYKKFKKHEYELSYRLKRDIYGKLITFVFSILIIIFSVQLIIKGSSKWHKGNSNELARGLTAVSAKDRRIKTEPAIQNIPESSIKDEDVPQSKNEGVAQSSIDNSISNNKEISHTKIPKLNEKTKYVPPKLSQKDEAQAEILIIPPLTKLSIVKAPEGTIATSNVYFAFEAMIFSIPISYLFNRNPTQICQMVCILSICAQKTNSVKLLNQPLKPF